MAAVDPRQVMALHRRTGLPVMDCKAALVEAGGDPTAAAEVLRRRGGPPGGSPRAEEARVRLDLRRDFAEVYEHLAGRVRSFDPAGRDVLGGPGPVRRVEVGFEYAQAGWVVVAFDARPGAEPDGEWTLLITGENLLDRPHWLAAGEAEGPVAVVGLDGTERVLPADAELAEPLGEVIKAVLLKARADGVFAGLPRAAGCELGVEHFGGGYGWPADEDRGRANLAEPGAAPGPAPGFRSPPTPSDGRG